MLVGTQIGKLKLLAADQVVRRCIALAESQSSWRHIHYYVQASGQPDSQCHAFKTTQYSVLIISSLQEVTIDRQHCSCMMQVRGPPDSIAFQSRAPIVGGERPC